MAFKKKEAVTYDNIADFLEDATDGLYATLLSIGWSLHFEVSAVSGATDKIFLSTGEDGTERLLIRITQTASVRMQLRIATYYPTAGAISDGNELGDSVWTLTEAADASLMGWIVGDKDFVGIVQRQGGYYATFGFGIPKRLVPSQWAARTTMSADKQITGAGNTSISVVDASGFANGQKLFVINTGSTNKGTLVRCTVVSSDVGAKTITVSNDSGTNTSFETGALVGLDPLPMCIYGVRSGNTFSGYYRLSWVRGASFLYSPATTRMIGAAQASLPQMCLNGNFASANAYRSLNTTTTFNTDAPVGARSELTLFPVFLFGHWNHNGTIVANGNQARGYLERFCTFGYGVVASSEDKAYFGTDEWLLIEDAHGSGYAGINQRFAALRMFA